MRENMPPKRHGLRPLRYDLNCLRKCGGICLVRKITSAISTKQYSMFISHGTANYHSTTTSTIFKRIHLRPVTILSFSLFSWSAAHATPFTQLLGAAESFFPKLLVLCMFWGIRPWSVSHQRAGILNISNIFIEISSRFILSSTRVASKYFQWWCTDLQGVAKQATDFRDQCGPNTSTSYWKIWKND